MLSIVWKIAKKVIPFRVRFYWTKNKPIKNKLTLQRFADNYTLQHNTQESMDLFFSDPQNVKVYLGQNRLKFYDEVVDFLVNKNFTYDGKDIADIGCGTGHMLLSIHNRYSPLSLTGFDYSEAALSIARSVLPEAQFSTLDIYQHVDLQYDVIFCVEVLEHLLYPDSALRNLLDMIKPSGVLLVTVPNGRIDTYEGHINFWSPESWAIFVKNVCAGFLVETGKIGINANFALVKKPPHQLL